MTVVEISPVGDCIGGDDGDGNGNDGNTFEVTALVVVTVGDYSGGNGNILKVTALVAMVVMVKAAMMRYSKWCRWQW